MNKLLLSSAIAGMCTFASYAQQLQPAEPVIPAVETATPGDDPFKYASEQFADIGILRYTIPGWDKLTLNQKILVYYLTEAGYAGRDIIWDQNYRYNLEIRNALEHIVRNYTGDKNAAEWSEFMVYTKRVWFSNGIHHHYSTDKIMPGCSKQYFMLLVKSTGAQIDPKVIDILFDPAIDNKKVNLDPKDDLLLTSATNFYAPDVSQKDVEAYYATRVDINDPTPISHGLNSRMIKTDKGLVEVVYKIDGLYGEAIQHIVDNLQKAMPYCENDMQAYALKLLIDYYKTGDLKIWDEYNIAWVKDTKGDIDYINSFIEVYNDPLGIRGSFESIVEINDFEASARMQVMAQHAQWFEDNSPIQKEHKKDSVVGVSYKVVNVAGESGDASPSTPIGVNLPNANWIRADHGSKSVSLGNIVYAYEQAGSSGILDEFCFTEEEKARAKQYGSLAGKMHTAMHEVIGHASGVINKGVGTPKETLKNYANTLEEARADLVALYYIMDPQLVEWGLIPNLEVGKAEYDSYIRNGLLTQLRRIEQGKTIEESHMRNRQLIAAWVYEKGRAKNVIERKEVNGKTYFVVQDYEALRTLFGELLREIQRIKSEGDYTAGMKLVETYGVQVDKDLHQQVLSRTANLKSPPYSGFINPELTLVKDAEGTITDVVVNYPDNFTEQMLRYSQRYGYLKPAK